MIQLKHLVFEQYLKEETILKRVKELAEAINQDYQGKNPIFLAVLNGSFMFMSDICKEVSVDITVSFIKIASYTGINSDGKVRDLIGLEESLQGRDVIIVEDIVDTGTSMSHLLETINAKNPKSVEVVSLLTKPEALKKPINIKYVGFEIPDLFVVGYGLDFEGLGRNLKDLYQIVDKN
ncbi:hypoxanthine phosphoribosyltransferase [Cyclobacterium marinum]|uniref:Hypoxanthine phosphoribosyltransferase n=1 Tax=Cyclobacterium marinum (strain ATCC 25205 / DSM 745 / LMG 13164 / NCIMB 1802) TaxID=880070 RepID=G0IVS6_CYCMS|nr:hypoxanthine phosphoribosyltransferase [Cyclobacterium marinum]AEL24843.1 hypoxanthine phosphoribosyltransferase [Cyclobacterium marinum DSM 745]MBR9775965.1 hypoxanthine phosphoribosyltransferase [Cytophagales bacterium]|tara:strand:+ start:38567 stop:39103 length:537 start_codon:yes stop_codon:yes gene_type:complete